MDLMERFYGGVILMYALDYGFKLVSTVYVQLCELL